MKIKSITKVKPRKVYAVTTSTGTFIADGLAHHNCFACNIWKQGATDEYALRLQKECGDDILQILNAKKQEIVKYYIPDYERLIEEYIGKIRLLDAQN